jgi:hypothetical protein
MSLKYQLNKISHAYPSATERDQRRFKTGCQNRLSSPLQHRTAEFLELARVAALLDEIISGIVQAFEEPEKPTEPIPDGEAASIRRLSEPSSDTNCSGAEERGESPT